MTDRSYEIGNSGVTVSEYSIGKSVTYNYNEKTKIYTITTESGAIIECRKQAASNKAIIYFVETGEGELLSLENFANANVIGSQSVWAQINLEGCNGCSVDASKNNKRNTVYIWDSENFKSQNNTVEIDSNDIITIKTTSGNETEVRSKGKYSENTVKSEMNSWWRKIFGYSKE